MHSLQQWSILKPTSKYGVIGSYNDSYDSSSDNKILEYSTKIKNIQDQLDRIEQKLTIEDAVQIASDKCEELKIKINQHAEGEKLQLEKDAINLKYKKINVLRTCIDFSFKTI